MPPRPPAPPTGDGGSRGKLILAIIGGVLAVALAIGIGFWVGRPKTTPPTGTPSIVPSTSPTPTPTQTPGDNADAQLGLPTAEPIAANLIVVPMRTADDEQGERPLYLVDSAGGSEPEQLAPTAGQRSNPMLSKARAAIIFIQDGTLKVIASDGSGERDLFPQPPEGCATVRGASWSPADPTTLALWCQAADSSSQLLIVGMNGQVIRKLDPGHKHFGDITISPDGQSVLYWASDSSANGGALYTIPLSGSGQPKRLTPDVAGRDADPAWSPHGSSIAFRRTVNGNANVLTMRADGTRVRVIASTPATDRKPIWNPDGKSVFVMSNRKTANGGPGKTWDLWLTRFPDGKVLDQLDLAAANLTTPTWTHR